MALLLAAPVAAGFAAAVAAQAKGSRGLRTRKSALLKTAAGIAAGFSVLFALFALLLHYDFPARLRDATWFHEHWKAWRGGIHDIVFFAWLDYLEFAVFLGVPLTILALGGVRRAILLARPARDANWSSRRLPHWRSSSTLVSSAIPRPNSASVDTVGADVLRTGGKRAAR